MNGARDSKENAGTDLRAGSQPETEAPVSPGSQPETEAPVSPGSRPETETPVSPGSRPETEAPVSPGSLGKAEEALAPHSLEAPGPALTPGADEDPVRGFPRRLRGRPVIAVQVEGEAGTMATLREVGIPFGAPLVPALIRGVVQRLGASGRWTDIRIQAVPAAGGVRLIVHMTPRSVISRVTLAGNRELADAAVMQALQLDVGSYVAPHEARAVASSIQNVYAERGYLEARAQVQLKKTADPSQVELVVRIREGPPTRIHDISFDGEQPFDPDGLMSAMGLDTGDVLDAQALERGIRQGERHLRKLRFFDAELGSPAVSIDNHRARVAIPCWIGPRYRLVISGNHPLERSSVYEVLELTQQRLTGPGVLQDMAERTADLYVRHGFLDVRAKVSSIPGKKPNTATLLVQIHAGRQVKVVTVAFPGARHFERAFLRDQLFSYLDEDLPGSLLVRPVDSKVVDDLSLGTEARKRRSVPPPPSLEPRSVYYTPTYEEALEHIRELYQAAGFLSARVGPERFQRIGKDVAAVSIPVVEGPRTLLQEVALVGNHVVSARELLTEGRLERHMPFSYLRMEEARLRMVRLYQERGYLYAQIEPSVRFSSDGTRAEVRLHVMERFPVRVGSIILRGARRSSHWLIRSLVRFQPGDLYRPSLARESEERMLALGVFSGVRVEPQNPDLPARTKPLLVIVTERPLQLLDFSAGVSTGQGVRTGFEYGYRNLFGQAVGVSLRVQLAHQIFILADEEMEKRFEKLPPEDQLERRITLGTVIPHLPGLTGVHTAIDLTHLRDNERDFGLDKNAVALTFTYPLAKRLTLSWGGDLERNNLELFVQQEKLAESLRDNPEAPRLRRLLRVPYGTSTLLAGHTKITYDKRDSPFVPTRGFALWLRGELAGTPRTAKIETEEETTEFVSRFLKLTLGSSGYVPVGLGVVLAGQIRLGGIAHLAEKSSTYPNRAFFLGGVDTIRGYFQDSMMPQDKADEVLARSLDPNTIVRSGDAFVLLRSELRFPIVGELQGGIFTDLGNLWADPFHHVDAAHEVNPLLLRPSAGAGIRLATPVGPLALDYGVILLRRKKLEEPFGTLHFSIGVF